MVVLVLVSPVGRLIVFVNKVGGLGIEIIVRVVG